MGLDIYEGKKLGAHAKARNRGGDAIRRRCRLRVGDVR